TFILVSLEDGALSYSTLSKLTTAWPHMCRPSKVGRNNHEASMISHEPIFRIHCELAGILDLGPAPFGHRRVVNILGGMIAGEKLNGRILPGGADWQILAADGSADIHARYTIESDAGAL